MDNSNGTNPTNSTHMEEHNIFQVADNLKSTMVGNRDDSYINTFFSVFLDTVGDNSTFHDYDTLVSNLYQSLIDHYDAYDIYSDLDLLGYSMSDVKKLTGQVTERGNITFDDLYASSGNLEQFIHYAFNSVGEIDDSINSQLRQDTVEEINSIGSTGIDDEIKNDLGKNSLNAVESGEDLDSALDDIDEDAAGAAVDGGDEFGEEPSSSKFESLDDLISSWK